MGLTVKLRLRDILKERGITQAEFSKISGLRTAAVSELCNQMRTSIHIEHIRKVAEALDIRDMNELIALIDDGANAHE